MPIPPPIDWPAAAQVIARALPPARWPERVRVWLDTAPADEPLAIAFSGGADSLALLLALAARRGELTQNAEGRMQSGATGARNPESGTQNAKRKTQKPAPETRNENPETGSAARLIALHFNHRLRGAAADADEAYCRMICDTLGVPLRVGAADWPAGSDVSEAEAREARFAFFAKAMDRAGARSLWLGHQRDDVAESMLLRLGRGSGSRGLAAPRPVQRMADGTVRLRPLLDVTKAEIVAALRAAGAAWCEDATNHGDAYFRNRLRRHVVPAWVQAAPADLAAAVARSRALLEEEDEALEAWADRVLPDDLAAPLPLPPLAAAPVAIARRALHRWLGAQGLSGLLGRVAFDELLATATAGTDTRLSASDAGFLVVHDHTLHFAPPPSAAPDWAGGTLRVPGSCALPDGATLTAQIVPLDAALRAKILSGEFDDGKTAYLGCGEQPPAFLAVRHWQPGDRYVPLGSTHETKLQDQFINRRIARDWRHRLPLVCHPAGRLLWVPGLPPADESRIGSGGTAAVQLTYLPASPQSPHAHG